MIFMALRDTIITIRALLVLYVLKKLEEKTEQEETRIALY